ncbi:MAG: ATP-binding protein, partial [Treponema sp.]
MGGKDNSKTSILNTKGKTTGLRSRAERVAASSKTAVSTGNAVKTTASAASSADLKKKESTKAKSKAAAVTIGTTASPSPSAAKKSPTKSALSVYDEDSILHLEGLEHIRLRPGMYIGSLGDGSNENDGIYILLKEGIDNAVDEFTQGFGARIDIEIQDGRVKIRDYGRGIPLGKLEDCVSNVNTGAKYNNSVFKQAIGMNGVGIKATNALSSYFRAASVRDGKVAAVEYERGKKKSGKTSAAKPGVKNGTYIEFVPDEKLFGKYAFNMDMVEKRLWNYAYLNPGLLIVCNGKEFLSKNGLKDLLINEMGGEGKSLYAPFAYEGAAVQFVMTHTASLDKFVYSFVNGQSTEDGGTHVTAFLDGFTKGVNEFFKKDYDQRDVAGGLLAAVKIGLDNPMFTSQTKNKLGNVEIRLPIMKEMQAAIDDWL